MKISDIGEFEFINRISKNFKELPTSLIGIGDDCAVIDYDKDNCLLVTTDMLVEDVHFVFNKISASDLGKKSIAVNISDIAAMGGRPHSAFISIGIPTDLNLEWLNDFYEGMKNYLEKYRLFLLGGDTTKSKKIIINIVVIGFIDKRNIKFRSGAKVGDIICVTGYLGESSAGLRLLLNKEEIIDEEEKYLVNIHNCPIPHLEEGIWLSNYGFVNSMMDVSDGIDSDLRRIMEMSNCGVRIDLEKLPMSEQFIRVCEKYNWDRYELAASGGEDYCLLITVDPKKFEELAYKFKEKFSRPLSEIGTIIDQKFEFSYYLNGERKILKSKGYDHFLTKQSEGDLNEK